MNRISQKIISILFVFVSVYSILSGQTDKDPIKISIGYSSLVFHEIKPQDASAAIITWTDVLKKNLYMGKKERGEWVSFLFFSYEELESSLKRRDVDLVTVTSYDYFLLKEKFPLIPAIAGVINDNIFSNYILLTRNDSGINTLFDLEKKILIQPKDEFNPLLNIWLSTLLASRKLPVKELFFSKLKIEEKESNCIYSVFFKKTDCAIVQKSVFNTVSLLNPQILRSIKIIETSPNLVLSFTALRQDTEPNRIKLFFDVAKNIQSTTEGKNILNVFKIKRLVDISDTELLPTRQLIEEYYRYTKKINR